MNAVEEQVRATLAQFYDALEDILRGRGTRAMAEVWHHGPHVTTTHPFGHWARGWNQVSATWEEANELFGHYRGHDDRDDSVGEIHDLHIDVLGDTAYSVCVYKSVLYLSDRSVALRLSCTNIVHLHEGVWKVHHHHPDKAPQDYDLVLEQILGG